MQFPFFPLSCLCPAHAVHILLGFVTVELGTSFYFMAHLHPSLNFFLDEICIVFVFSSDFAFSSTK